MAELVRAKHEETGAVAALSDEGLRLGMHPGWVAVDGPVPSRPKSAVLKKPAGKTPEESADNASAEKKE
jgi:hypothetical protein